MTNDLLILNIRGLVQVRHLTTGFLAGKAQTELPVLPDAFLLIKDGLIADYGSMGDVRQMPVPTLDAEGCYVFPSFVDSHTHMVFAASREHEFVQKIKGATYQEIAAK